MSTKFGHICGRAFLRASAPQDLVSLGTALASGGFFTRGQNPGKIGEVTVTKSIPKAAKEATTFEEMEKEHKAGKKREPIKFENLVPTVYQTSETTTLEAEVKDSGENTFTFPLKS